MNFTRHDYETILYSLEGYIQGNDDDKLCDELVDICYRIERKLSDMDYRVEDELAPVVNNEEKTIDYRGNSYAENVDALVARMGSGWH
tara:strand:- start:333 stop:596 length:264 start_codon:yes stop_codon:yes gene_type:complete